MLRFFRQFRQRLLTDNKFSKYLLYAIGEIALVVIGILIALQIDNWNEARRSRVEEIQILANIKKAFLSDIDNQFALHYENIRGYILSTQSALDHINKRLPLDDSVKQDLTVLSSGGSLNWTPQLTAYKRLEAKGIDIIENESLLEAILDIYNLEYPMIQNSFDNYLSNIHEFGRPLARTKFITSRMEGGGALFIPVNEDFVFESVELRNVLLVLNGNSTQIESRMLRAETHVNAVIGLIDEELRILK